VTCCNSYLWAVTKFEGLHWSELKNAVSSRLSFRGLFCAARNLAESCGASRRGATQ